MEPRGGLLNTGGDSELFREVQTESRHSKTRRYSRAICERRLAVCGPDISRRLK